jgi:integrase
MNPTPKTTAQWIEQLRLDRIDRGWGNPETWKNDYGRILGRLPQSEPLTGEALMELIKSTTPNSRQRLRTCMVTKSLATFAGIPLDAMRYRGRYSSLKTKPRTLPDDALILATYHSFKNPYWRWVFGVVATYGLRPHEALLLDFDALRRGERTAIVLNGKTGPREVWPFHPEWFDEFHLQRVLLPGVDFTRSHIALGRSVSKHFQDIAKIPFKPYDLRHAWAVRTVAYGYPSTLAAKQMGHDLRVHNSIYHKWINKNIHDDAYARVLGNPDRPLPPKNIP